MRWNNLSIDVEERARLPGYPDEAVVRHFDAPEAMSTNFYEVRAKTILNRVPEASQMPFRWTINPYRGCTHACSYCLGDDTRVLCANGREVSIRDLEVGTQIYGTRRNGAYRRLVASEVLDKWSSIKPAFVVELEDGTELVASEEHRFLSRRGWRYVLGSECGRARRPHLTVGTHLLGPGGSSSAPEHDQDYRRGYLRGIVRGDANLAHCSYERPGRTHGDAYRFRLALADQEALDRARRFLDAQSIFTTELSFAEGGPSHRPIRAIRSQARVVHDLIIELIRWPVRPTLQWVRGFLAGTFDAEGSYSLGVMRISNTDEEIIAWTVACAQRLGFEVAVERRPCVATCVRLRGGLAAQLRFLLTTDPAITRKRRIDGRALKSSTPKQVSSVRALGMTMRMYDISTGTGDFIANGVVSHNCFARPTHKYLDFDAGRDFEREIVVKVNAPERLRVELARPSWQREHIALGTNTDPYQWVEGRYKLMRGIWEAMIEARNPGSVLTKSPLLLRDLDLMQELAARAGFSAALSVPTLDERAWRATEPHTPHPRARLEAVAELVRAGIPTGVLIAPLMPGINDAPEQLAPLLGMAAEAGASYVTGIALHLRSDVRRLFFQWLSENRGDLVSRYRDLYRYGAYAPAQERRRLASLVQGPDLSPWQRGRSAFMTAPESSAEHVEHRQESLFDPG
ncbi:MAG: LAGLIDADG family homing endonuclease [Solirubrobacteraceae bacterium]